MTTLRRFRILLRRCELGAHHLCEGIWGDHLICTCTCHHNNESDDN